MVVPCPNVCFRCDRSRRRFLPFLRPRATAGNATQFEYMSKKAASAGATRLAMRHAARAVAIRSAASVPINTGFFDSKGRIIWQGPRGGEYVMQGMRKIHISRRR